MRASDMRASDIEDDPLLYRFLYLDFERVRSVAAMLFGGVPERAESSSQAHRAGRGEVRIGIPGLPSAAGSAEVLYLRTSSETRSLHHHLLRAIVRRLEELKRLPRAVPDAELPIGEFFVMDGEIVIRDYAVIRGSMESLKGTIDAFVKFQDQLEKEQARARRAGGGSAASPAPAATGMDVRQIQRQMQGFLPPLNAALENVYGDAVRLYCKQGERLVYADLDRTHLTEPAPLGLTSATVGGTWSVFCGPEFGESVPIDLSPALSPMETVAESLFGMLAQMGDMLRPRGATAVRPIAVYREI